MSQHNKTTEMVLNYGISVYKHRKELPCRTYAEFIKKDFNLCSVEVYSNAIMFAQKHSCQTKDRNKGFLLKGQQTDDFYSEMAFKDEQIFSYRFQVCGLHLQDALILNSKKHSPLKKNSRQRIINFRECQNKDFHENYYRN